MVIVEKQSIYFNYMEGASQQASEVCDVVKLGNSAKSSFTGACHSLGINGDCGHSNYFTT